MSDRREVVLGKCNLIVWEAYLTCATQFAYDFRVTPWEVLGGYGVPAAARPGLIRRLAMIYELARKNRERVKKAGL